MIEGQLSISDIPERDLAPNRVRVPDHETSELGAASIAYRAGSQKAKLMVAYRTVWPNGLTDEEAAKYAALPPYSCYWKRCNELRNDGLIEPTGQRRPGVAGVDRMVCRLSGEE